MLWLTIDGSWLLSFEVKVNFKGVLRPQWTRLNLQFVLLCLVYFDAVSKIYR